MRRALTFISAVAAVVLAIPAPAYAASGISAVVTASPSASAATVATQGEVYWTGGTRATIDSITISVAPAAGQPMSPASTTWCSGSSNGCGSASTGFTWTTPVLPYNGAYQVTVNATGSQHPANPITEKCDGDCQQAGSGTTTFKLAVPPSVPKSVSTSVDPSSHAATIAWNRNNEPDMLFYVVQRKGPADAGYQPLTQVAQSSLTRVSFTDTTTSQAGGLYGYQVFAVRSGADAASQVNSNPAAASALVEGPPPTTAAPASGGAPGSSGTPPQAVGAPGRPPILVQSGTVDASKFSILQSQTKIPTNQPVVTPTTVEPDAGFNQALPFRNGKTTATTSDADGSAFPAVVHGSVTDNRKALLVSLAFAAIIFIVAFHLRVLMRRIDQVSG